MFCSAILLAAGKSQRLGINKLLLPYKTIKSNYNKIYQPVILHSLNTFIQAEIPLIIIVLGYQYKIIQNKIQTSLIYQQGISKSKIRFIFNRNYKTGMASSIATGTSLISDHTEEVLICLADKPGIKPKTISQIIARAKQSKKSIIIPVYDDREGHPVLFKKKYFTQLKNIYSKKVKKTQDYGARYIIDHNPSDVFRFKVKDKAVIQDIDTWQDYIQQIIAT